LEKNLTCPKPVHNKLAPEPSQSLGNPFNIEDPSEAHSCSVCKQPGHKCPSK
jgi:hypothetical protein